MAKRKTAPAVAPRPPVEDKKRSAETMAALDKLRYEKDGATKRRDAWLLVTGAAALRDFGVLHDFALEHGLIRSCEDGEKVWTNPVDGSEMVWIPGGSFYLGGDRRRVECAGFSMARYPVTNEQFKRFLDATKYQPPEEHPTPEAFLSHWSGGTFPKGLERHPVVFVSFIDALAYCQWAKLTLPTEWAWEKAARGTDGRSHPWGNDTAARSIAQIANVGTKGTTPVDKYPRTRSAYGCEDMVGNVSEWCQTTPDDDPSLLPPLPPEVEIPEDEDEIPLTVVRGSCFLRAAGPTTVCWHRRRLSIIRRNYWTGFRPALLLPCKPAN
jgi:serine/threonine-protein kinase